jgi:hypothetical protein
LGARLRVLRVCRGLFVLFFEWAGSCCLRVGLAREDGARDVEDGAGGADVVLSGDDGRYDLTRLGGIEVDSFIAKARLVGK